MSRLLFCAMVLSQVLLASPVRASNKLIAVLPLDVRNTEGKMSKAAQASLEEMLRDVAANTLRPNGWTVLSGENMLQVLRDNGVEPEKCGNESCHLSMAREIKTEAFISGAVQYVDGEFTASIRLIDTRTGSILASALVTGRTVMKLRQAFEAKVNDFFARGGLTGNAAAGPVVPDEQGEPAAPAVENSGPRVRKNAVTEPVGQLTVTAKPKDKVRLELIDPDGHEHASGVPYENAKATPGRWKATAKATGYEEEQQEFDVPPDDVTLIKFELKPLGGLSVHGQPSGAAVVVDGPGGFHDEGGLPWEASGLKSGTYQVKVTRRGYTDDSESAEVLPGKTATITVSLHKGAVAPTDGQTKVDPKTGLELVYLTGGTFHYGCEAGDNDCDDDEKPGREVTVGPFWLGRTVVTVAAYAKCVSAGVCSAPPPDGGCNWNVSGKEQHPINCIDSNEAKQFCTWIGGRLPTAEEWEYAAKGGEGRIYPWGNTAPNAETACYAPSCGSGTAPADSHPSGASRHGLLNMVGNVWQWTASDYGPGYLEVRGSCWNYDSVRALRTSFRSRTTADARYDHVGVRCALSSGR